MTVSVVLLLFTARGQQVACALDAVRPGGCLTDTACIMAVQVFEGPGAAARSGSHGGGRFAAGCLRPWQAAPGAQTRSQDAQSSRRQLDGR
jgi:hypothetical protein